MVGVDIVGYPGNVGSYMIAANINVVVKPIGPICNLSCRYCFYLEKEQFFPARHRFRMSDEVLETYIRHHIEAQDGPEIGFLWQGGEPTLMGLDFFEKVIALQQRYKPASKSIANALQTNGTLLTDDWCRFLGQHRFLVGLSLDGPPRFHDKYRRSRKDEPTHQTNKTGYFLNKSTAKAIKSKK